MRVDVLFLKDWGTRDEKILQRYDYTTYMMFGMLLVVFSVLFGYLVGIA